MSLKKQLIFQTIRFTLLFILILQGFGLFNELMSFTRIANYTQADDNLVGQILEKIQVSGTIIISMIFFELGVLLSRVRMNRFKKSGFQKTDDYQEGFYGLMESLPLGLVISKPDGEIVDGNNLVIEMLGYKNKNEMLKSNAKNHYTMIEDRNDQLLALSKENYSEDVNTLKKCDGSEFIARINSFQRIDESGEIIYFNMLEDISEIKKIEADLESQTKLSDKLIDLSPIFFVGIDVDGKIRVINQLMLNKTGYIESEVIGKDYLDLFIQEEDEEKIIEVFEDLSEIGATILLENIIKTKNGEMIPVEWHSTQITNEKGEFDYFLGLGIDISERKRDAEKIQHNLKRMNAMREIDRAITLSVDLFFTMNMIIDQVAVLLEVDAVGIMVLEKDLNELSFAALTGFNQFSLEDMKPVKLYDSFAGQVAVGREMIHFEGVPKDYDDESFLEMLKKEKFTTYYGLPLITKGEVLGVLEIYHRSKVEPTLDWIDAMNDFAGQTAIALDHSRLFGQLTSTNLELSMAYDSTLEGWASALELRDEETQGHSVRVTKQTLRLAQKFGVDRKDLIHIRRGSLLHDIGKMGIPDNILLKPGKLTEDEWEIMKTHPLIARDLLIRTPFLKDAIDIPYGHHEKWDGTGYPQGLKGKEIPLAARIFSIIDAWDALLSDRPYRNAWTLERVVDYLRGQSGIQFDPEIINLFLKLVETDKIFTEHVKK